MSDHQGQHDQGELRKGIRMLMANILPQRIASSSGVNRSTICCHRHRLCETRRNNDRLRSEQPQTDRSSQPVSLFIFAKKKTNVHFIKGTKTRFTTEMRLRVIMVPYVPRNDLVFLQDSAPCLTTTACTEYLQLKEILIPL